MWSVWSVCVGVGVGGGMSQQLGHIVHDPLAFLPVTRIDVIRNKSDKINIPAFAFCSKVTHDHTDNTTMVLQLNQQLLLFFKIMYHFFLCFFLVLLSFFPSFFLSSPQVLFSSFFLSSSSSSSFLFFSFSFSCLHSESVEKQGG